MCLIKVTAHGVSEVDEERMNAGIGHVSQNDSLVFPKRQVNLELFSMGQERQSAADTHEGSLLRKRREKKRSSGSQ